MAISNIAQQPAGSYRFVNVRDFTPNLGQWKSLGNVNGFSQAAASNQVELQMAGDPNPQITFCSPTVVRVRFNPAGIESVDNSNAVVTRNLGPIAVNVQSVGNTYVVDTGIIQVVVNRFPYGISVLRNGQLIHADTPSYNLVYIPGQQVIANFKQYPANARYFGFGEKAGATLAKNNLTMTFFNFDNFEYVNAPLPPDNWPGPLNPSEALYCSVPLLIESNPNPTNGSRYSYGLFYDNPAQSYINIGASDYSNMFGKYYFGSLYGEIDYYFIYGTEVPQILNQYTQLTGRAPMPPRYVFGFHQGCYGYYDQQILEQAAGRFRAANIPIDGLHIDVDFQNNYRTFTHSQMKFPDGKTLFDRLHAQGFKCSTNITPLITDNPLDENNQTGTPYPARDSGFALMTPGQPATAFIFNTLAEQGPNPDPFDGHVSYGDNQGSNPFPYPPILPDANDVSALGAHGFYPDLGRLDVQQWWGQQYQHLVQDLTMDMIWQDMTCPALAGDQATPDHTFTLSLMLSHFGNFVPNGAVHNIYVLNLLKATYEGLAQLRPNLRNFIIARGGYAGMQRYAALWTGDSASSWDFLRVNIPEVLNLGLSGIPVSGCDIGGFGNGSASGDFSAPPPNHQIVGGVTNYELLTRWMHLGSFLPWYRNHYNGYTKQFQEPWAYGDPVPANCRKYVELRYRMLHVYYSAMYECTQTGMPIARALFLNDPLDLAIYDHLDDQFFVGHDILVAPILDPHETANPPSPPLRNVYLPAGSQWYAFKDNVAPLDAPVNGGTVIQDWYAPLDLVPIYVRAGAILPMRELEQYVGQLAQNPITFNIYPGADSSFQLYFDDGVSTSAEKSGTFRVTAISHAGIPNGQRIRVLRNVDKYNPPEPFYFVSLLGTNAPASVVAAGTALPNVFTPDSLATFATNAYYYNASIKTTFLKIFDNSQDITMEVTF